MDAYQAGQQLGTLLFGGAATTRSPDGSPSLFDALSGRVPQGDVYNKTLLTGAQAQNAMQEARMNRAKAMIEENMAAHRQAVTPQAMQTDRKSTRLNSSHPSISYAVFCLKKKKNRTTH